MKRLAFAVAFLSLGLSAFAATVTDVTVSPRWPWEDKVDIDYTLDAEDYGGYAVTVALYDGDTALEVAAASLPGNGGFRLPGRRRQVFDYARSGLTERPKALRAVVTATEKPVRYMIVDLLKTAGEEGQREYVYSGDERLVSDADFPVTYRVSDDPEDGEATAYMNYQDVWFSVTNDTQYAKTKMVFRFVTPQLSVPTGKGDVSTNGLYVALTKPYWIAIYPMTFNQYSCLMWNEDGKRHRDPNWGTSTIGTSEEMTPMRGGRETYLRTDSETGEDVPSKFTDTPYDTFPNGMRGPLGDETYPIGWPTYGHAVSPTNTLAAFREKTGLRLDYPTEAQWEVACRAGGSGLYGDKESTVANTNLLLRFASPTFLKKVGDGRLPNGWGIYDMLGNCGELMLDAYVYSSDYSAYNNSMPISGYDPVGPQGEVATTNRTRIVRGLATGGDSVTDYLKVEAGTRIQGVYQYVQGNWSSYRTTSMRWVVELDD